MTNPIEDNAYRILGLDGTASQKGVLRRYKEIGNRLKIDDKPVYELDINLLDDARNEETVNEALKSLQSQKRNIKEYFFWFEISNKNDQKFVEYITKGDYEDAVKFLKELSKTESSSSFFYKKNLAILYCLLLAKEDNTKYLEQSLSIWEDIIKSEKFWDVFEKNYSIQNEQILSKENIQSFKKDVVKDISDIYTDLGQKRMKPIYVREFQERFGVLGESAEKNLLKPTFDLINEKIMEIQKIKIEMDDKQIQKKIYEVQEALQYIQIMFDRLKKNGLYNANESKVIRDHVAEAVRIKAVEINNLGGDYQEAEKLIKSAEKIAGTESYKSTLETDVEKIGQLISNDKNSIATVKISGFLSSKLAEFKPRFVEYEGKKMFYKDVMWITHNAIRSNYSTTYYFTISDGQQNQISLNFSDLEAYKKVLGIAYSAIIPRIVKRYIDTIFEEEGTVTIGEVEFDKKGYTRTKFFGGYDGVSWKEIIYTPQVWQGSIILYKDNGGRGRVFSRIPMTTWNAVVLPALVKECVNKAYALGIRPPVKGLVNMKPNVAVTYEGRNEEEAKRQNVNVGEIVKKAGDDSWVSYTGAKYYMIKNIKTGLWDICSNNKNNPPLEKHVWAGDFKSKEEAERYLKETLQDLKSRGI